MEIATGNVKFATHNFHAYLLLLCLDSDDLPWYTDGNKRICPINNLSNKDKEIHHTINKILR
jgi:hypothetical protein